MSNRPAVLGGTPIFREFVPLVRPTLPAYTDAIAGQVEDLFRTGMLTKGRHLREFERRVAEYIGVGHAVAVSSCTLGLMLTYHGLGLSGEVVVPSFTFMATVHPLRWLGITPVFVDIDPETWNVDPACVEAAITERTSAIVAVHNFGNPALVDELQSIADRHRLPLVLDAAHGFGARYRGRPVGALGRAEVFSLSPTKLLVAGEGGIVTTNDDELARHIAIGREYGNPGTYGSDFPGLNARMPEFSALLGCQSLAMLDGNAQGRNRVADVFRSRLGGLPGVTFQRIHPADTCSFKDFSMLVDEGEFGLSRDHIAAGLKLEGVDTRRYHYPAVHTHDAYRSLILQGAGRLPVTEQVADRILSLPIWSHMESDIAGRICTAIERLQAHAGEVRAALLTAATPSIAV